VSEIRGYLVDNEQGVKVMEQKSSLKLTIATTRFGNVIAEPSDVFNFPEGILGFSDLRRFILLDDPNDEIFTWLQSCESSSIAFPVLDPELFVDNLKLNLTKADLEALKLLPGSSPRHLSIITIPEDPTQMTANLKAPIIFNVEQRIARQCVLQDNSLAIREPIFMKLQERVVRHPDQMIKSQNLIPEVTVRVEESEDFLGTPTNSEVGV
jgi:flagellar assembly factor FliW